MYKEYLLIVKYIFLPNGEFVLLVPWKYLVFEE